MKDGIIKADGTSRLARSVADFKTKYPTYDDFAAALVAGTLPLDILFNEVGWRQVPDFLGKASLFDDETAEVLGMSSDSLPKDALQKLGELLNVVNSKKANIAIGSYVGTGKYGSSNKISLNLGFKPKFVLCATESGLTTQYWSSTIYYVGSFIWNEGVTSQVGGYWQLGDLYGFLYNSFESTDEGFEFYGGTHSLEVNGTAYKYNTTINDSGETYYYVAIG